LIVGDGACTAPRLPRIAAAAVGAGAGTDCSRAGTRTVCGVCGVTAGIGAAAGDGRVDMGYRTLLAAAGGCAALKSGVAGGGGAAAF